MAECVDCSVLGSICSIHLGPTMHVVQTLPVCLMLFQEAAVRWPVSAAEQMQHNTAGAAAVTPQRNDKKDPETATFECRIELTFGAMVDSVAGGRGGVARRPFSYQIDCWSGLAWRRV